MKYLLLRRREDSLLLSSKSPSLLLSNLEAKQVVDILLGSGSHEHDSALPVLAVKKEEQAVFMQHG